MSRRKKSASVGRHPRPEVRAVSAGRTVPPRRRLWLAGALVLVVLGVVGGAALLVRARSQARSAKVAAAQRQMGGVTACKQIPAFAKDHGFGTTAVIDSQTQWGLGVTMYQPDANGQPASNPPPYQHISWRQAGYLGSPVLDRDGAIYAVPIPWISVLDNPVAESNTVFRIDPKTGVMTPWLRLPPGAEANSTNVFGALALAYDCDTHSLYVSSVYGSTRTAQLGRLFHIDVASGQVTVVRDHVDAIGLAVFNTPTTKRLYYGLARSAHIESIALDEHGQAAGEPRLEIDLAGLGYHGDERARRINIAGTTMTMKLRAFDYTLAAPTNPNETLLSYVYNTSTDRWERVQR